MPVALALLWSVVASSAPAGATNFSGANGATDPCVVNAADNRSHRFFYNLLEANTSAAVTWSRTNNYDPTDISTVTETSNQSTTDVVVYDADYETPTGTPLYCGGPWCCDRAGWIGFVVCVALNTANECEKHEERLDTDAMLDPNRTATQRRAIACHENGHTLGLTHQTSFPTSCMTSPPGTATGLVTDDRNQLNSWVGYDS